MARENRVYAFIGISMKFSKEQLNSFIKLYKEEFNENISEKEALIQARALVSLVKLTYKQISRKELEKYG